jgi:hypothetical protein
MATYDVWEHNFDNLKWAVIKVGEDKIRHPVFKEYFKGLNHRVRKRNKAIRLSIMGYAIRQIQGKFLA